MWFEPLIVHVLNRLRRSPPRRDASGIVLATSVGEPAEPVTWSTTRRTQHAVLVGKTGTGKTHGLQYLAIEHMRRGEGFALIDFHGDAVDELVRIAATHPESAQRLVVIDPSDPDRSPGLNPLEIAAGDEASAFRRSGELARILRQRWQVDAFGPRTEELLRHTLFTLAVGGYTLVEAPWLLTSRTFRTALVSRVTHPEVYSYWTERYEPLSEPMKGQFREALLNKITAFLTEPASRHLLGQVHSTVDFSRAMATGQWVLIKLSKGRLGEHAHTLGNLLFAQLQFAILHRASLPPSQRRLFSIMADEVQNLQENDLVTVFAEGRKFGASLITANQYWQQLAPDLRGALLSAGTHLFFRVSAADAVVLSAELSVDARHRYQHDLTSLPIGEAIVRIGSDRPVQVRIPPLPTPTATPAAVERLRALTLAQYTRARDVIEAEIRHRRTVPLGTPPTVRRNPPVDDAHEGQTNW